MFLLTVVDTLKIQDLWKSQGSATGLFTVVTYPVFRSPVPVFTCSVMSQGASSNRKQRKRGKKILQPTANTTAMDTKEKSPIDSAMRSDDELIDDALINIAATVGDCVDAQAEHAEALNEHSDLLSKDREHIKALHQQNLLLQKKLDNVNAALVSTIERVGNVERTTDNLLQTVKNANIVVEGLAEISGENCADRIINVFTAIDSKFSADDIISAYRVGAKSNENKFPRSMVVKLQDTRIKMIIMENKGKLWNTEEYNKIFLNDDLPPKIKNERRTLREIAKFAHQLGYAGCKASGSKLVVDGKAYRYDTLHLLPEELQLCNVKTRKIGDGLGFQSEKSFLSNFFPVTLTNEQQSFSSSEQAYNFFKARTCRRDATADKIMSMSNPRYIKEAGESFPSTAVWEAHKEAFMRSIVFSKFKQNEAIKMKLLATGEQPLYECTRNRWWGCGLRFDSPEWANGTPPGLNKMGTILMEVRAVLRKTTWNQEVMIKSPSAILKSITAMSDKIQKANAMEEDFAALPVIDHDGPSVGAEDMEVNEQVDTSSSTENEEELLEQTDVDEESVNISASSSTSTPSTLGHASAASRLNVTREDGKLDMDKINKWSIPKLGDYKSRRGRNVESTRKSQRLRRTLPFSSPQLSASQGNTPNASSTPHPKRLNRSLTLQAVQDNLRPSKLRKKENK